MKITAEQFVESLARLSDEEKQKAANLLVNKWKHLTNSFMGMVDACLLYTSPSPRDLSTSRMPSSA